MTYNPNHDRSDWRALSTKTLIEAARDCPHELAIALGERLEELEDFETEAHELRATVDELGARVDALRAELEAFYDAEAGA
jgi:polyhydroxyalkanoate synthesis regulator phasin